MVCGGVAASMATSQQRGPTTRGGASAGRHLGRTSHWVRTPPQWMAGAVTGLCLGAQQSQSEGLGNALQIRCMADTQGIP
jgi:hypothetical protein